MNNISQLNYIYNTFGGFCQIDKLKEEILELLYSIERMDSMANINEEISDVKVLCDQFYLNNKDIREIYDNKIDRTMERIESGYYKTKDTNSRKE